MRKLNLVKYCDIPSKDCKRGRECKSRERCEGFNACEEIKHYTEKIEEYEENYGREPRAYEFCDCSLRFYICPHLILKEE